MLAPLPAADVPFPVEATYRTRPDLRALSAEPFLLDAAWPAYAAEKLHLLRKAPQRVRVLDPAADPSRLADTVAAMAERVAATLPDAVQREDDAWVFPRLGVRLQDADRVPVAAHDAARIEALAAVADEEAAYGEQAPEGMPDDGAPSPRTMAVLAQAALRHLMRLEPRLRLLDALALSVQEDLVVMRADGAGERPGRAELLHVCFPSHWDPAARAGASLAELHGPVPHGDQLRDASPRLLRAMSELGPYQRFVWSVDASYSLDRHPSAPKPPWPTDPRTLPDRLAFRVERQTTQALPGLDRALFTIRVQVASLRRILDEAPDRGARLAEAVRSMDAPLLAYKGLGGGRRDLLLEALEGPTR